MRSLKSNHRGLMQSCSSGRVLGHLFSNFFLCFHPKPLALHGPRAAAPRSCPSWGRQGRGRARGSPAGPRRSGAAASRPSPGRAGAAGSGSGLALGPARGRGTASPRTGAQGRPLGMRWEQRRRCWRSLPAGRVVAAPGPARPAQVNAGDRSLQMSGGRERAP